MDSVAQSFLAEIERFLSSAGIDPSALGKGALGDPNFVFDLRKGRSPSTRTIDKVRGWIGQQSAPAGTPKSLHRDAATLTHLERLEAESISIIREVAAELVRRLLFEHPPSLVLVFHES